MLHLNSAIYGFSHFSIDILSGVYLKPICEDFVSFLFILHVMPRLLFYVILLLNSLCLAIMFM